MTMLIRTAGLLAALLFASCDILRDGAFEVDSWSPGPGSRTAPFAISLHFSAGPDRASVERALSVSADGVSLRGSCAWDGDTVTFVPAATLPAYADFRIDLSTEAEGGDGLSLERAFMGRFSTRSGQALPRILSSEPVDEGQFPDMRSPVRILFSTPQSIASLGSGVEISPAMVGTWGLGDSPCLAVFTPLGDWQAGEYRVTVPGGLPDAEGRGLSSEKVFHFSVAGSGDRPPPELLFARGLDASHAIAAVLRPDSLSDGAVTENPGWEASWYLAIECSGEVSLAELDARLSLEGTELLREGAAAWGSSAVYRLAARPAWGSRISLKLAPGLTDRSGNAMPDGYLFRMVCDGPASRPPQLEGLRFPLSPDGSSLASFPMAAAFSDLAIEIGHYPLATAVETRFELYLALARGAAVDPLEVMEHLRVEASNGAFRFSPRSVRVSDFTWKEADPAFPGAVRIEVAGLLTNAAASGLASFTLTPGFSDSLGNETAAAMSLPLVK